MVGYIPFYAAEVGVGDKSEIQDSSPLHYADFSPDCIPKHQIHCKFTHCMISKFTDTSP